MKEPLFRWPVKDHHVDVIDGDTCKVLLDRGFGDTKLVSLRLLGVDTPESRTRKNLLERYTGKLVTFVVKDWIEEAKDEGVTFLVSSEEKPKYAGRIVGHLWSEVDSYENCLSNYLSEQGLCRLYNGGRREPWKDRQLELIRRNAVTLLDGKYDYEIELIKKDCGIK